MRSAKKVLLLWFFLGCGFFFSPVPAAQAGGTLSASSCSNNCQNIINQALSTGGTVYLTAGTYVVSGKMYIKVNNTTLTGDKGAVIRLISNANWPREADGNGGMIEAVSVSNIRITGFEIDGNRANNTVSGGVSTPCGRNFYTLLYFYHASNIEIDHMYLHHNWNDIVKYRTSDGLKFHDNNVRQPGHDIVYGAHATNVAVYNNYMRIYCNSGARCDTCNNFYVYGNDIARDDGAGGNAAIELQGGSPSGGPAQVWVCNNTIGNVRCVYDLEDGKSCWVNNPPNNPFVGTIHTTGCPASGAPEFPAGGTGGEGGGDTGGGDTGGDTAGGDSGGEAAPAGPSYWYPTESLLNPSPYTGVDLAVSAEEQDLGALYPRLNAAPTTATAECLQQSGVAGFIPCSRHFNDPATPWNECADCNLCSLILMGQLVVEFLIEFTAVAATLSLVFAGFVYVFAAGKQEFISQAKLMISYSLIGFFVVFISWAIVDSLLMTLGYIDPVGGSWHTIC